MASSVIFLVRAPSASSTLHVQSVEARIGIDTITIEMMETGTAIIVGLEMVSNSSWAHSKLISLRQLERWIRL